MIFVVTFVVMAVIISAMAVGVIFANKPIKGSCGGMSSLGWDTACDICGGNPKKCEEEQERKKLEAEPPKSLAYDATRPQ